MTACRPARPCGQGTIRRAGSQRAGAGRAHHALGLSLVEVVVALVILALAVPPLMFQLGAGVQQQRAALIQQNLTQLAAERMWQIFADHADPTRGYDYIQTSAYPPEDGPWGLSGYRRVTTVREVSPVDFRTPQPGSGIKRFQIVVSGPGGRGSGGPADGWSLRIESVVVDVPGAAAVAAPSALRRTVSAAPSPPRRPPPAAPSPPRRPPPRAPAPP